MPSTISIINPCLRSVINRRQVKRPKREYQLLGKADTQSSKYRNVSDDKSIVFSGRSFCAALGLGHYLTGIDIMTSTATPAVRTKAELESLVKSHGGTVFQSENAQKRIIVIADKSHFFCVEV
jgi:DNA ligase 4